MEQGKFTHSFLGKVLEQQIETTDDQCKKQIKAIEDHEKQFVKSSALIENNFRERIPLEKRIEERYFAFTNLEKILNSHNLIYKYNIKRRSPKSCRHHLNSKVI